MPRMINVFGRSRLSGLLLAGLWLALPAGAQTYLRTNTVAGSSQLATALGNALPGDLILLSAGNYAGFTVTKSGTAANPIAIQSATPGVATNNSGILKFQAVSNVILSGLTLTTSGGSLTVDGTARNVGVVLTNCLACRLTHCNFKLTGTANGTAWVMLGGPSVSNRVDHCDFGPNSVGGGTHFIWPVGNATIPGVTAPADRTPWAMGYGPYNPSLARYTQVDHNYFHDEGSGDGEIMVLGAIGDTGDYQDAYTLVEYNLFAQCNGDPEIISVKSSGNVLRYNTVTNSAGVFSLRAGNHSSVYGNYFLCGGTGGGVKLSERDHRVFNNYIQNTDASNYPLMLEGGNLYNAGFSHAQVVRAQIVHNTIVNAGRTVLFAHSGGLPVTDTVLANNLITTPAGGTIYSESATSVNCLFSSNLCAVGNNPNQTGFLYASQPFVTNNGLAKLAGTGPAIGAADGNYYPYVTEDIDGQPRTLPRDLGADEYAAGAFIARPPLTTNAVGPGSVDLELSATPTLQTVQIGATNVSYAISLVADAGFTSPVTFTVSGLLPGISAGFSPATVNGSGLVTLNLTNTAAVLGGNYPFTITATSGNLQVSTAVQLQIGRLAAGLRWAAGGTGAWTVQSGTNWFNLASNAADAFYNGDAVLLDDTPGAPVNLTLAAGVAVSPAVITNSASTNNYVISVPGKITGPTRWVKTGTATLTVNTTNDFGGGMLVAGGTLKPGNPWALGGSGGFIILTNGATLDVNGFNLGLDTVMVSGTGVSNSGAIINTGPDVYPALALVELAGNTTIGGTHRWDLRAAGGTGGNPGTASLSTSGNAWSLTKTGTNFFGLVSVTVDPALANVNVTAGTLDFEGNTTGLGNPAATLTVSSNASVELWSATNWLDKLIVLNGGATLQNGSGANVLLGAVTLSGTALFNIGGTSLTCSNRFSGPGGLIKTGAATLFLAGTNACTGGITISNGTLALMGGGELAGGGLIRVVSGTVLDASGRSDQTLTLTAGQSLHGNGSITGPTVIGPGATVSPGAAAGSPGTLTISGTLQLQGSAELELNATTGAGDQLAAGNVVYGGTLVLTNLAGILSATNTFKLFNAAGYAGAFAALIPAVPGPGLAWNTNTLASDGTLRLLATVNLHPTNLLATVAGGILTLSWPADYLGWRTTSAGGSRRRPTR